MENKVTYNGVDEEIKEMLQKNVGLATTDDEKFKVMMINALAEVLGQFKIMEIHANHISQIVSSVNSANMESYIKYTTRKWKKLEKENNK